MLWIANHARILNWITNDFKIEYLFSYWAIAHPITIPGKGVQYDFDDVQWVQSLGSAFSFR